MYKKNFLILLLCLLFSCDQTQVGSGSKGDNLRIEFLPSPFLGIILVAILASAMTTLSSSINSMSMTVVYDWLGDNSKDKNSIFISLLWSVILLISSLLPYFLVSEGLVELGLKISSFFFGPLIGVFTYIRFAPSSHNLDSISFFTFVKFFSKCSKNLCGSCLFAFAVSIIEYQNAESFCTFR